MDTAASLETDGITSDSKYTTCPYNRSHRILKARVQYHLVKCKRNVKIEKPDKEKSICPFDATHHVDKEEFEEHVKNCPNRKIVDSEKYTIVTDPTPEEEAAPPPPSYNFPELPPCEENWDDPSEPTYTYDPTPHLENQPILRTMHGATKSERKAFRQVERMKMLQFMSGQPMDSVAASNAAGVTVDGGRLVSRGRGQNRLPLGRGSNLGGVGSSPVNLEEIVNDRVGHILPCHVEAGPLRQPRGTSMALAMAKSEESPVKEAIPEILPSSGAIRKVKNPQAKPEEICQYLNSNSTGGSYSRKEDIPITNTNSAKGDWCKVASSPKGKNNTNSKCYNNDQKNEEKSKKEIDWWESGDQQKKPSTLLQEYKEQTLTLRLASNLGIMPEVKEKTDEERAQAFTYKDDEWTTQMRRGRRGGIAGRRGLTKA